MLAAGIALLSFSYHTDDAGEQLIGWSNKCLLRLYSPNPGEGLKKCNLILTADYFLRLNKYFTSGRQEYYSFNLRKFKDMDYLGTTASGWLRFRTAANDVIVQTYHDPKGDIDSMAARFELPVRDATPEQLDSLRNALLHLKYNR